MNNLKDNHHPNLNSSFYSAVGRAGANFAEVDLFRIERVADLYRLNVPDVSIWNSKSKKNFWIDADQKAERLVQYYKNYQDVLEKLKLQGDELFANLCKLPFDVNWNEKNYHERKEEIIKIIQVGRLL